MHNTLKAYEVGVDRFRRSIRPAWKTVPRILNAVPRNAFRQPSCVETVMDILRKNPPRQLSAFTKAPMRLTPSRIFASEVA